MVNRRATFLAGGDERGKRPSEAPIERLFRAVGQGADGIFRMSGIGGLHRIAASSATTRARVGGRPKRRATKRAARGRWTD